MKIVLTHEGRGYFAATAEHLAAAGVPGEAVLDAIKVALKAEIDVAAEHQRLRWITAGAGQAMTYARKVEEARAVRATTEPVPSDYPMLAASIGIDGPDIEAVAETVLAMDAAWAEVGAAIEATRLAAKQAVDMAEDASAAAAVSPKWPY